MVNVCNYFKNYVAVKHGRPRSVSEASRWTEKDAGASSQELVLDVYVRQTHPCSIRAAVLTTRLPALTLLVRVAAYQFFVRFIRSTPLHLRTLHDELFRSPHSTYHTV